MIQKFALPGIAAFGGMALLSMPSTQPTTVFNSPSLTLCQQYFKYQIESGQMNIVWDGEKPVVEVQDSEIYNVGNCTFKLGEELLEQGKDKPDSFGYFVVE